MVRIENATPDSVGWKMGRLFSQSISTTTNAHADITQRHPDTPMMCFY